MELLKFTPTRKKKKARIEMGVVAKIDRDANDVICGPKRAVEIASKIAGYEVNPSTLQQAVNPYGRIRGFVDKHVMWYVIDDLKVYAKRLGEETSTRKKREAAEFINSIQKLDPTVRRIVIEHITKGAN